MLTPLLTIVNHFTGAEMLTLVRAFRIRFQVICYM